MDTETLAAVFIEFADTLVDEFDITDFLRLVTRRCGELLDVTTAGILLGDHEGSMRIAAASTEQTRILELLQLLTDEGPCPDCFRTRLPVVVPDLTEPATLEKWPRFAHAAIEAGFASVHTLPMRLRGKTVGALNLFDIRQGNPTRTTLHLAQALADMATIGILQERAVRHQELLSAQLQQALDLLRPVTLGGAEHDLEPGDTAEEASSTG
ncbi:GAF domain-containing protein [Phytomonospora endophytica]|uniref:GAF domain-containing protein n=1 Tax=Phytomonospora endophytica TaxID=714109 RepID=A0A841FPV7_9ACTN|nr:GAF domain-containing protein [Phytomonospora endophytica]MBB6037864.1 GAF domain-containing protein [Phytomonospora endophytica]GIG68763.1 hypothetical protein Pen01_50580 [Phytomonospora endophytica]